MIQQPPSQLLHAYRRLERQKGIRFELYYEKTAKTVIESKDLKVESLSQSIDTGISVRVLKDQRMGFSYTTSLAPDAIDRAVDSALATAAVMPRDDFHDLYSFKSTTYPTIHRVDHEGLRTPLPRKIAIAQDMEKECRAQDRRIVNLRKSTLAEYFTEVHLIDTEGTPISHQSTLFMTSIGAKAEENGDSQMGWDSRFSHTLAKLDWQATARTAAHDATRLLHAKLPPTAHCPAVFENGVVTDLLGFLSNSFSAEAIDKGRSLLLGKEGAQIASPVVTLIDEGHHPDGMNCDPFDGEGVPVSRTTLLDAGQVSGFLYNLHYANKMKRHPTASSSRSIKAPPSIGFHNLILKPGRLSLDALLSDLSEGVFITGLMGLHTANPVTGDFSLGAEGFWVEKGKCVRPIKGFAVAGNILGLLHRTTDVGSDFRFSGNVGAASIRVSELSVGGGAE